MKPTDTDLNRAYAEACGWTNIHEKAYMPTGKALCGTQPGATDDKWGFGRTYIPRYCNDRNALPELWDKVEDARVCGDYGLYLVQQKSETSVFLIASAPARQHVIAALKALDKWNPDWSEAD